MRRFPLRAAPVYHGQIYRHKLDARHMGRRSRRSSFLRKLRREKSNRCRRGAQNFWEWMVEGLYNFLESVIGTHLVKKTFWFFATIFIFILFLNWFGLIPGVGTIGWGHHDPTTNIFQVDRPLLRGANADLNLTFAMAMVFFALWIVWALQENGIGGFIVASLRTERRFQGPSEDPHDHCLLHGRMAGDCFDFVPPDLAQFPTLRQCLRGRKHARINGPLVPALSWLIPIPFYFMELLVGVVQALVFMLLTAVFTLLIAPHEPGPRSPTLTNFGSVADAAEGPTQTNQRRKI